MNNEPRLHPGYLGNQNNARYPLPPSIPAETVCLRVNIPKSLYWYTVFWNQLFQLGKWTAYAYDDNKTATVVAREMLQLLWAAKQQMPRWDRDSALCDCPPQQPAGGLQPLPDCIEVSPDGKTINIDMGKCPDMVINIYQNGCGGGCGCGCGGNGGKPSRGSGFGSNPVSGGVPGRDFISTPSTGATYDGYFSDCDFATGGGLDYIMDQAVELWTAIANNAEAGLNLIHALWALAEQLSLGIITAEGWGWLKDITETGATNISELFDDFDFRNTVKMAWIKTYPNAREVSGVNQDRLIGISGNIPQVEWEGLYPYPVRQIWTNTMRFLDIDKLNTVLPLFEGDCNQQDYGWLYQQAGVAYLAPPDEGTYPDPVEWDFDWHYEFVFNTPTFDYTTIQMGNLPDQAQGNWDANLGVGNNPVGGQNTFVGFQWTESLWISAVKWYVDEAMDGDLNETRVTDKATDTVIKSVTGNDPAMEYLTVLDEPISISKLLMLLKENSTTTTNYNGHVWKAEIWGMNTPPTEGTAL